MTQSSQDSSPGAPVQPGTVNISRSRALAWITDDLIRIPGTSFGIGADAVIGLVPGVGDLAGVTLSTVVMWDAVRARVPVPVLARMGWNIVLDAGIGVVPGIGDIGDVVHRANRKNYRLLEREVARNPTPAPATPGYLVAAMLLFIAPLILGLVFAYIGLWILYRLVTG